MAGHALGERGKESGRTGGWVGGRGRLGECEEGREGDRSLI